MTARTLRRLVFLGILLSAPGIMAAPTPKPSGGFPNPLEAFGKLQLPWQVDWKKIPQRRRLAKISRTPLGLVAEVEPAFDYTAYLPCRYRIEGVDSKIVEALATKEGLNVRLLGRYYQDRVQVSDTEIQLRPPILPLPTEVSSGPWRGRVLAQRLNSRTAQLTCHDGQSWQVDLEFDSGAQEESWLKGPASRWIEATCWKDKNQAAKACDIYFEEEQNASLPLSFAASSGLEILVGEQFLEQTAQKLRQSAPEKFSAKDPMGLLQVGFEHIGVTLQNSSSKNARLFGNFTANHAAQGGLGQVFQGQWEVPIRPTLQNGKLRFSSVQAIGKEAAAFRMTVPLFAEVPALVSQTIVTLVETISPQLEIALPTAQYQQLIDSQLITAQEFKSLRLATVATGDRRSSRLRINTANINSDNWNLNRSDDCSLWIGADNLNRFFQSQVPKYLPYQQAIPAEAGQGPNILFVRLQVEKVEIRSLKVQYRPKQIAFEDCVAWVHWSLGPLHGVEPGVQLSGQLELVPNSEDGAPVAKVQVGQFQFLSKHVLALPTSEQEQLRAKIIGSIEQIPLQMPVNPSIDVPLGGPVTQKLQLRQLRLLQSGIQIVSGWAKS